MEHECLVIKNGIVDEIREDVDKTRLKEVKIPEGVTEIYFGVFQGCESLESVEIPEGVKCIDEFAFEDCKSLKSVTFPASVTRIGSFAFYGCDSLKNVEIPASVKYIGQGAFGRCKRLKSMRYGGTLEQWYALKGGGYLTRVAKSMVLAGENGLDLRKLTTLKIPEGVTVIEEYAFMGCKRLKRVEIPASVTSIGEGAFYWCESLASAKYGGTLAQWCILDGGGFLTSVAKSMILVGEDNMDLKKLTTLKIPEGVTVIGDSAFKGCESLESVEIPANVTGIGFYAFDGCESLESAKYGGTLAQWCVLDGGGWLTSVAKSMVLVGENGLDLKKLTTLKIPEGVTYIKRCAFEGCDSLKSVEIPSSVKRIESRAFYMCMNIESVMISEGVTRIEWFAFSGCKALKSVVIPASATRIGSRAFDGCESLESAKYGGTFAQWCALDGGRYLTSVAKSVILVGEDNMDLKRQTALKIPEGVTYINHCAFEGCDSLESVDIPSSVTRIGQHVFIECESLESVNYGGTKEQWRQIQVGWVYGGYIVHCTDGDTTVKEGQWA